MMHFDSLTMIKLLIVEWNYMNNIWVDADMIWTPNLYFSNRVQDFVPSKEVILRANIGFDGRVTFYRSLSPVSKFLLLIPWLVSRVSFFFENRSKNSCSIWIRFNIVPL